MEYRKILVISLLLFLANHSLVFSQHKKAWEISASFINTLTVKSSSVLKYDDISVKLSNIRNGNLRNFDVKKNFYDFNGWLGIRFERLDLDDWDVNIPLRTTELFYDDYQKFSFSTIEANIGKTIRLSSIFQPYVQVNLGVSSFNFSQELPIFFRYMRVSQTESETEIPVSNDFTYGFPAAKVKGISLRAGTEAGVRVVLFKMVGVSFSANYAYAKLPDQPFFEKSMHIMSLQGKVLYQFGKTKTYY